MFLLVPYAVDVPFDRKPFMNWLLVISVIAAFLFQVPAVSAGGEGAIDAFVLKDWNAQGLFGHMWLHGDPIHLGGNMLFLWIFGNAVCAKVGNLKFLPIYLGVGLCAAMAHLLLNGDPAVGASGAINGIVGMFLVFFWQNEMDCLFFMMVFLRPIVKTFSISSYWMIVLWLVFDIWGAVAGGGRVAYFAHLGGFFAGAALAVLLLKLKMVTMYRGEQSLVGLADEWKQSRQDTKLEGIARAAIDNAQQETDACPVGQTASIPQDEVATPKPTATLRFTCPCGKQIKAPIQHAGKKGRCPQCRQTITIPVPTAKEY